MNGTNEGSTRLHGTSVVCLSLSKEEDILGPFHSATSPQLQGMQTELTRKAGLPGLQEADNIPEIIRALQLKKR